MPIPAPFDSAGWRTDHLAAEHDLPFVRVWTPENLHQGALAGAVLADQSVDLPGSNSKSTPSSAVAPPKRLVTPRRPGWAPRRHAWISDEGGVGRSTESVADVPPWSIASPAPRSFRNCS